MRMPHLRDLKPDTRNARRHTPRNLGQIEAALRDVGAARSIVVDEDGTILAGNATVQAAKDAGITDVRFIETDGTEIIAVRRSDLTPAQKTRLALWDNRAAELAEWDTDVLAAFQDEGTDLSPFWMDDELDTLLARFADPVALTDPDDVPEPPKEPITKPGDLWLLGRHRLLCGDSTVVTDVETLMGGEKADMVFTDPPYGMDLDTDFSVMAGPTSLSSRKIKAGGRYRSIIGDNEQFDPSAIMALFGYVDEQFWWGADYYAERIPNRLDGAFLVWDKRVDESLDKRFGSSFELVWSKQRHKRDVVRVQWAGFFGMQNEDTAKRIHPTQKPTALAEWFLERYSKPDDLILDLFGGSGSTLIVCEQTNRRCAMMEIDPTYCDVIVTRWQNFTGQTATLAPALHVSAAAD